MVKLEAGWAHRRRGGEPGTVGSIWSVANLLTCALWEEVDPGPVCRDKVWEFFRLNGTQFSSEIVKILFYK